MMYADLLAQDSGLSVKMCTKLADEHRAGLSHLTFSFKDAARSCHDSTVLGASEFGSRRGWEHSPESSSEMGSGRRKATGAAHVSDKWKWQGAVPSRLGGEVKRPSSFSFFGPVQELSSTLSTEEEAPEALLFF